MNHISDFNPEAWQTPSEKPTSPKVAPNAASPVIPGDVASDVEFVLQQIEERHVDITADRLNWVRFGFAFADQFGEAGRPLYHRLCKFFPKYTEAETDDQYNKCLKSQGSGVTMRTFFMYARDAGIDIRTRSYKPPKSPKPPISPRNVGGDNGDIGDSGATDRVGLPTFSDIITPHLPAFLRKVASYGRNTKETDTLILAAITVVSGCLPNLKGSYDEKIVYANLFFFLSARAGSGKGRVDLCRRIAGPIHYRLRELYKTKKAQYDSDMTQWENTPRPKRGDKPTKPLQTMLYIPCNTSATAFTQLLNENGERGIIFTTEADGVSSSFESDFGDYSETLRAAFHHESVAYHRRGNDEDVEVKCPRLSVVLTGTPKQVARLFGSAENGLFSRIIMYRMEAELVWRSVLKNQGKRTADKDFDDLGEVFTAFYDLLCQQPDIFFSVSESQSDRFDDFFKELLDNYSRVFPDDIAGSIFRLGLICYRIAMVLSAIRLMDSTTFPTELVCTDEDFNTALTISRTIAVHMAKVYDELSATDGSRSAAVAKSTKRQMFFAALPEEFDRQDYLETAAQTDVPPSTAEKWIRAFCKDDGPLEKVEHGRYRKR